MRVHARARVYACVCVLVCMHACVRAWSVRAGGRLRAHLSMVATPSFESVGSEYEFSPFAELAAPTTPRVVKRSSSVVAFGCTHAHAYGRVRALARQCLHACVRARVCKCMCMCMCSSVSHVCTCARV